VTICEFPKEPGSPEPMIVNMRGVWGVLSKVSAIALAFGGTVRAVDNFRCHDSFFTVVVDSTLDARTSAYVEPIRVTKKGLKGHGSDAKVLRELSEMWIDRAKHGQITQVYPGYYGESLIDGPKGDIFRTCSDVANKLSECAEQEALEGDPNALLDAVRSIEVINIIRYGSYETIFTSSAYLRKPTKLLRENLDKLTPEIADRLSNAQNPDERNSKLQALEQVVQRQRNQYALRYGAEMTKEDDSTYVSFLRQRGDQIAAERFFGFDREIGYAVNKKSK
jgi:hypothetical protein